jgi:hypothetical protein
MYRHRPQPTWTEHLQHSARTLAAIVLTALLASALTVEWSSQAEATGLSLEAPAFAVQAPAIPVTIDGTVIGVDPDRIAVLERGAETPVAFLVGTDTRVVRQGEPVALDMLRAGDAVQLMVDGRTGLALRVQASPAGGPAFAVPAAAAVLAAVGLIAGAAALAILSRDQLPALSARRAAPRLPPVAVTR